MSRRAPRSDAGTVRATARDALGMSWVVEMYGMPLDLLRRLLADMSDSAARNMVSRWRRAGWVESGQLGGGPMWVWATAAGVERFGRHPYAAHVPSAAQLLHTRGVILARLGTERSYNERGLDPAWRSERELRWELGRRNGSDGVRTHVPDAELEYSTRDGDRVVLAYELELTPKEHQRTVRIIRTLLSEGTFGRPYVQVVYGVSNRARPVVERAVAEFKAVGDRVQIVSAPEEVR